MPVHLEKELATLKKQVLAISALVEGALQKSVHAVQTRDAELAQQVIAADREIDQLEVQLEEECLKILALHQPVAIDLRFIIAMLKMNNDLERIGDLAVNIAQRAVHLTRKAPVTLDFDLAEMAAKSQAMLRKSLDAVVGMDADLARQVREADDEVDAANREVARRVKAGIRGNIANLSALLHLLLVARHIERVADLATNIAEDAIYMVEGRIVRHRPDIGE
jgi:phosphate transport system protein